MIAEDSLFSIRQSKAYQYLPRTLVMLGCTFLFYWIGTRLLPYSGDAGWIADEIVSQGIIVRHSPLSSLIQNFFYWICKPFGFIPWQAISMSSAVAGAVAVQVLFAMRRNPLFLVLNLCTGSFLVFAGMVENYAWVNLFLLCTFYAVEKFFNDVWRIWPVFLFFFLAVLCHFLAFFYLPALFWVLYQRNKFHPAEFLIPFTAFLSIHIVLNVLIPGEGISFDFSRLVPLFEKTSKLHHFTFFSWDHLRIKYFFHVKSAFPIIPVGWDQFLQWSFPLFLPLEIPALILLRKRINTPYRKFLLLCSLTGLIWTTLWHPDLGPLDWDLFSQMGIPIHLLIALLLIEK